MTPILRVLKIGLVDFWRNRWLSLASTIIMIITVFMVSLFVLLDFSVSRTAQILNDKIDISAFFTSAATDTQINDLVALVKNRPDVKEVQYVSSADALTKFKERSKYRTKLLELLDKGYGANLPRSISVKASDPQKLSDIASFIKQPPYDTIIQTVSYEENKDVITKVINSVELVERSALYLSILFLLIAILVVYNTINLTIYMRREEIEIMQLVGATGWFIKFPFILEGIIYGLLAAVVTTIVLFVGASAVGPSITRYIDSAGFDFGIFFIQKFPIIIAIEFLIGVVVGGACSFLAVRKQVK